jgi:hypothetical protein
LLNPVILVGSIAAEAIEDTRFALALLLHEERSRTEVEAIMMYLLEVNALVAAVVFGLTGLCLLGLFVWTQAVGFARSFASAQRNRARLSL